MEYNYTKFDFGKFGGRCDREGEKERLRRRKQRLRVEIDNMPEYYWRHYCLRKHRERVLDALPHYEISDRIPKIPVTLIVKDNRYKRRLALMNKIDVENARLLTRIRHIFTSDRSSLFKLDKRHKLLQKNPGRERIMQYFKIANENCNLYERLQNVKPMMETRNDHAKWYQKLQKLIEIGGRYPPYKTSRPCAPFEKLCALRARDNPHPLVFMDLEVDCIAVGRIFIELRADIVPMTAENFRSTCTSDRGVTYRCAHIDKIIPGLLWQGGYIGPHTSIFGESFPEENFVLKHSEPGIVSMVSYGPNTVNTEFRITAIAIPPLDGKAVVVGKVVGGMDFLFEIKNLCKLNENGNPRHRVIINGGGQTTFDEMEDLPAPKLYKELEAEAEAAVKTIQGNREKLKKMHEDRLKKFSRADLEERSSVTSEYSVGNDRSGDGLKYLNSGSDILSGNSSDDDDGDDEDSGDSQEYSSSSSSSSDSESDADDFKTKKAVKARVKKVTYKE